MLMIYQNTFHSYYFIIIKSLYNLSASVPLGVFLRKDVSLVCMLVENVTMQFLNALVQLGCT